MPKTSSKESSSSTTRNSTSNAATTVIKPLTKSKIKSFPCSPAFECKSGELLWGQIQHMITGSKETGFDNTLGPITSGFGGGTILQSTFRYRLAARKGNWVVDRFEGDGGFGFVIHHQDVSGQELLDRCAKIGISNGQNHDDRSIVYVNRYDWSYHSANLEQVSKELEQFKTAKKKKKDESSGEDDDDDEELGSLLGARLILLDATEYQSFMKMAASGNHPENGVSVQFKSPTGTMCGVHCSDDGTEYELGWMVFSGSKHEDFPQDDEFVGFVYDASYCALEEGPFTIV